MKSVEEGVPEPQGVLGERLWELQQQGLLCDILVEVGDQTLPAHRVVLSASSPFILQSCMKKAHRGTPLETIHLTGADSETCWEIVKYMYLGKLKLDTENVRQIHKVCKLWQISSAVEQCATFLASLSIGAQDNEKYQTDTKVRTDLIIDSSIERCRDITESKDKVSKKEKGLNHMQCSIEKPNTCSRLRALPQLENVTVEISCTSDTEVTIPTKSIKFNASENVHTKTRKKESAKKTIAGRGRVCDRIRGRGRGNVRGRGTVKQLSVQSVSGKDPTEPDEHTEPTLNTDHSLVSKESIAENNSKKRRISCVGKPSVKSSSSGDSVNVEDDGGTDIDDDDDSAYDDIDNIISESEACAKKEELQCRRCNKNFQTSKELAEHNTRHKHKKCRRCHMTFETNEELQEHRKVHQKKRVRKRYECEVCNRDFASLEFLKSHKFTKHWTEDMGPPIYYYCEVSSENYYYLRNIII